MKPERMYLLLGSNEGDRLRLLHAAIHYLTLHLARGPVQQSNVFETAAWGKEDQPSFLNVVLGMNTIHPPELVLAATQQIEQSFGRIRKEKWGQRTLDIDILLYGDSIIDMPGMVIPHPRLQDRRFALVPLAELAPDLIHPVLKRSINTLLKECPDTLEVKLYREER